MENMPEEGLRLLLERAGLELSQVEIERLRPLYEEYLRRLKVLHSVDLQDEEVAGVFIPSLVDVPVAGEASE